MFSGAFREIPLRTGESIDDVSVSEGGRLYAPGASAELGSRGTPGTYGVARTGKGLRIVWHYSALSERRTFDVHYRLRGVAVAYDDVVDVNLKVWGDEWKTGLGRLTSELLAPGRVLRAWGHPVWVRGDVALDGEQVYLRAIDIPATQFVELRALIPRSAFTSTLGMQVRSGPGLQKIVAQERKDAAAAERDHEKIRDALDHLGRTVLVLLLLGLGPALLVVAVVGWVYGRERRTGYDREYEQEPPADTEPALVPTLLRQGGTAGSYEFTATLFDLIRRGRYKTTPVTTKRGVWGGLRTEEISDLEVSPGSDGGQLAPFEAPVAEVADAVLAGGAERLSRFRDTIEDHRKAMSERFASFKTAVGAEGGRRGWWFDAALAVLAPAVVLFALVGAVLLWIGIDGFHPVAPSWHDVVIVALGGCALANAVALGAALTQRRLWRRRTRSAEAEAERWEAFRRYLTDFPRLQEAPPASLELWERYLVYGIAFGIAERVLQGAQLHMPKELHDASTIYWISPTGDLGSGPSALGISDLAAGFGSALAPPSSGSGGFGGGFSGGGGFGGGGGGGGGAW